MGRLKLLGAGLLLGMWIGSRTAPRVNGRRPQPGEFDFLALMSHELKTPINILIGYLELLADDVPEPVPESARVHVRHARIAALRLGDLVNDLLTWTRLRAERERVYREPVLAADILESACSALEGQAEASGIRLQVEAPEEIWVWTDPIKACQALRPLIANGLKFTERGTVNVTVEERNGRVRFRVRDTGIGIPSEHLERIFEPYWQAEASVRRTRGGVGLGLTLSRELARLLDGRITVRSLPGKGSEFVLDLPARPAAGPLEDDDGAHEVQDGPVRR